MKALLVIAHGSRVGRSNTEIAVLVEKLKLSNSNFDLIDFGFLEMAQPNIMQAGAKLVALGATNIKILPYFLVAGNHVVVDIPAQVETLSRQFPRVEFSIAPYLGCADGIVALVAAQVAA